MPLPETIPVKYSEEEAEFISMRPLIRQTFRAAELVDMIVSVTGKDLQRIQQILRSGTIVFHSYRYWWQGIDVEAENVSEILTRYPDSDPARPFRTEDCTEVILDSGNPSAGDMMAATVPRHTLRLRRADASLKRLFRSRSLWSTLVDLARENAPAYREYSYALRGDLYILHPSAEQIARLARDAAGVTPRSLRVHLAFLPAVSQITFVCPRHQE
ncbi:MAG: hypothetical protein ACRD5M_05670 [Candidatus Acidiferrales bacterium]